MSHTLAFESTIGARISPLPFANLTPTAVPFSTMISSTCVFRRTSPPYFSKPRCSALAISSAPPRGNSLTPKLSLAPNTAANSALTVPLASTPLNKKHSKSAK